jgi:hypothetical protein
VIDTKFADATGQAAMIAGVAEFETVDPDENFLFRLRIANIPEGLIEFRGLAHGGHCVIYNLQRRRVQAGG